MRDELKSLLSRLHVLVVGPGLGREDYMQKFAMDAIWIARNKVSPVLYIVLSRGHVHLELMFNNFYRECSSS